MVGGRTFSPTGSGCKKTRKRGGETKKNQGVWSYTPDSDKSSVSCPVRGSFEKAYKVTKREFLGKVVDENEKRELNSPRNLVMLMSPTPCGSFAVTEIGKRLSFNDVVQVLKKVSFLPVHIIRLSGTLSEWDAERDKREGRAGGRAVGARTVEN